MSRITLRPLASRHGAVGSGHRAWWRTALSSLPVPEPVLPFPLPRTKAALDRWSERSRLVPWGAFLRGLSMPMGMVGHHSRLELPSQVLLGELMAALRKQASAEDLETAMSVGEGALAVLRRFEADDTGRCHARRMAALTAGTSASLVLLCSTGVVAVTVGDGAGVWVALAWCAAVLAAAFADACVERRLRAVEDEADAAEYRRAT